MATAAQTSETAAAIVDCANEIKSLMAITNQALDHNSALSIDWNSVNAEDIADATDATPAEVSNAIGSLASLQTYWETHGGNFEKLAKAIA
jgi:methyl-accepting chemotaxis protein